MNVQHLLVIIFFTATQAMELSDLAGDWIITWYDTGSLVTDSLWKGRLVRIKNGWVNMKPVIDKQSSRVLLPEVRQKLIVKKPTILLLGVTPNLPHRFGLVLNPTRSHQNKLFWNHKKRNYNNVPYWYNRAVFTKICDDPNAQRPTPKEVSKQTQLSSCLSPGLAKMLKEKSEQLQKLKGEKTEKLKNLEEEKNEMDMQFQNKQAIHTKKQWGPIPKKLVGVGAQSPCLWNSDGIETQGNAKAKTNGYFVSFCTDASREDNDNRTLLELERALALSRLLDKLGERLEQPQLKPKMEPLLGQSAFEKTYEVNGASKTEFFEEDFTPTKSTTSTIDSQGGSENEEE